MRLDFQHATVELTHLYSYAKENWRFTPVPQAPDEGLTQAWEAFPPDVGSTHGAQLIDFIASRDRQERPLTSGHEARRTLDLLTSIYKSAFTGTIVTAGSIQPGDPFYASLHGGDGRPWRPDARS